MTRFAGRPVIVTGGATPPSFPDIETELRSSL